MAPTTERGKYNVPAGMTFSRDPEGLRDMIREMAKRFGADESESATATGTLLHDRIRNRRLHLQNDPAVDPALPAEWKDAQRYQTTDVLVTFNNLMARGVENHYVGHVRPLKDTPGERKRANELEAVMNSGDLFVEERSGIDIQAELFASQVADCYGVLHWCKAEHLMPPVPEPEYAEDIPEGEEDGYMASDDAEAAAEAVSEAEEILGHIGKDEREERRRGRYREKSGHVIDRWMKGRAKAGYPWWMEVVDPLNFVFVEDRSLSNGMSRAMVIRDMPISDYVDKLRAEKDDDSIRTLAEASNGTMGEYGQRDGPDCDEPSAEYWGKRVRVYQLWTRTEFYEVIAGTFEGSTRPQGDVPFHCVKAFKHPYKMPPFSLALADVMPSADPANRYMPMLEPLYRLKPVVDRGLTMMGVLAEQSALPYQYWENPSTGETWTGEDGESIGPKANSSGIDVAPAGYVLQTVEQPINPALVEYIRLLLEQFEAAKPPSGFSQVGASTQPWTIRLDQQQQSVLVKRALRNCAKAIAIMRRNQAMVMGLPSDEEGAFSGPICVYGRERDTDGGVSVDYSKMATVWPGEVESLDVYVTIDAVSSAERITIVEHGANLLERGLITEADFYENYMGKGDPDEYITQRDAAAVYKTMILPRVSQQMVNAKYGEPMLGADGAIVGPGGESVAPLDVLMSKGIPPDVAQALAGAAAGGGGQPTVPGMGTTAGPLPGLSGPQGAMPLPGMAG